MSDDPKNGTQLSERPERKPMKLRFDELIGERDTFETAGGETISFVSPREFDAVDSARLDALQKEVDAAIDRLGKDTSDEAAARTIDEATEKLLKMILPDIDEETLGRLKTGGRLQIIEWWARRTRFFAGDISGKASAAEGES